MRTHIKNIFLADDDNDEVVFFKDILGKITLETKLTVFSNGEKLIDKLKEIDSPPDILLLDLEMPKLNGIDVLMKINELNLLSTTPIVIYTVIKNELLIKKSFENGAWGYLIKPFDMEDLKPLIERLLIVDWQNFTIPDNLEDFIIS